MLQFSYQKREKLIDSLITAVQSLVLLGYYLLENDFLGEWEM